MIRFRGFALFALAILLSCRQQPSPPKHAALPPSPPKPSITLVEEAPAAEPSVDVPTLVEASATTMDGRTRALASELSKMWTRNPEELVTVIDNASRRATLSPSVTLLLAIAHAETNGKILPHVPRATAAGGAGPGPVAIEFHLSPGGSRFEEALFEMMRKGVRLRGGGNVQVALGRHS